MPNRPTLVRASATERRLTLPICGGERLLRKLRILAMIAALPAFVACGYIGTDGSSGAESAGASISTVASTNYEAGAATPTAPQKVASDAGVATPTAPQKVASDAGVASAVVAPLPGDTSPSIASTGLVNSLDTIANDMRLRNDLVLRGYENMKVGWYVGPGYVNMGNKPRTSNTGQWFKDAYPEWVNDNPLRAILPWLVLFDGVGHASTNTRVHFRNMKAFYKSKRTGQWVSWGSSPGVSGHPTPKSYLMNGSIPEDKRVNSDGSVELKPPTDSSLAWHGWWSLGRVSIDPADIDAVFLTVQARLVADNPSLPDDRSAARLLIQIGADYYIDTNTSWTVPTPGVGVSRAKLITNDWQAFSFTTFSDVGIQEPGGGITEAAFRANPPPLD